MAASRCFTSGCRTANNLNSRASSDQRRSSVLVRKNSRIALSFASGSRTLSISLSRVRDSRRNFLLQQREKQVFLAVEVGVERAPRVAGIGGDFFQLGRLESVARKNLFRRLDQPRPGDFGALLVARQLWPSCSFPVRTAITRRPENLTSYFCDRFTCCVTSNVRVRFTYMHVCIRYTMKRMRRNSFESATQPGVMALTRRDVAVAARASARRRSRTALRWRRCPRRSRSSIATPTLRRLDSAGQGDRRDHRS